MNLVTRPTATPRPTFQRLAISAAFALVTAFSPRAEAAPCAGFDDVDDGSPFCQAVEWMKNRAITLGCTATSYCPADAVSRLAMAAFMKRLGDALTPVRIGADADPGPVDLDANIVVCQTAEYTVTGFPRTAYVDASLSAVAFANVNFAADVVASTDGGASWSVLHPSPNRSSVTGGRWSALADVGVRELDVGDSVRFGVRLSRGGTIDTTNLSDSTCQLRTLIYSRTGAATPFDMTTARR